MKKMLSFLFIVLINNVHAQTSDEYPTIKLNSDIDLLVGSHSRATYKPTSEPPMYHIYFQSQDSISFIGVYYNSFLIKKEVGFNTSGMSYATKIGYQISISTVQVFRTSDHAHDGFDMKYVLNKKKRTKTKGKLVLRYQIKGKVKEVAIPLHKILRQDLEGHAPARTRD